MNPNSPENRLLDELLHEQSHAPDEAFLKQIETAVDAGPPIVVRKRAPRNFRKWSVAAGVGLAAAIAFFFYLEKRDLRKSVIAAAEMKTAVAAKSEGYEKSAMADQDLDQAIRDQEQKVEERRKELASIVRTKGIIYKGQDSYYGPSGVDSDYGARGVLERESKSIEIPKSEDLPLLPPLAANEGGVSSGNLGGGSGKGGGSGLGVGSGISDEANLPVLPRAHIVPPAGAREIAGNAGGEARAAGNVGFGRDTNLTRNVVPDEITGDRYGKFIDQPWKSPAQDPLSTFSIDVDTASYSNVRRMIREGREIPKDAVRIEEFINAFQYSYAAPKGDGPFAVSATLAACPWAPTHQLVRVAIKGREIETNKRPASNLVFLIDVSGSMQSPDKLPLLKQSMATLVEQLDERDRVAIVVYAGTEGVALPSTRLHAEGRATVLKALGKLEAGGSTNGGAGIKRAYELAMNQKTEGGVNRVILATDGDFNVGVTGQQSLVSLVKDRAKGGVYLTVLGFGTGNLNDAMMDAITRDGNGNYFYIDSEREGRKVFLQNLSGTLVTIAKDVKIQVEFNPAKVGTYRLIGYSNRVLRNEDFKNDKVDAGDIGAGHTVTAFYELTPPPATDLKYQAAATSDEWLTVKLRHKHPDGDESRLIEFPLTGEVPALDKTDADFQFATAAALFGMKLRGMEEVTEIGWDKVLELAKPGLANDAAEDRAEFVELVKKLGEINIAEADEPEGADGPEVRVIQHEDGFRSVFSLSLDRSRLTQKLFTRNGEVAMTANFRLNSGGDPIACQICDAKNQEMFKITYGYGNSNGRLVEELMFDARVKRTDPGTGKELPVRKVTYPYDEEGRRGNAIVANLQPGNTFEQVLGFKGPGLGSYPFEVVEMLRNDENRAPRPRVVPPPAGEAEVVPFDRNR